MNDTEESANDRPARLVVRTLITVVGVAVAAMFYLDDRPSPWQAAVTLVCAAISVALFAWLALYPGELAPRMLPTPKWWALSAVLATSAVVSRLVGGQIWVVAVMAAATTLGAGASHRRLGPKVTAIVLGAAATAVFADANQTSIMLEGLAAGAAALFGAQAWRRVAVMDQLRETRRELARVAVAEERIRIARDLHDLLGHTLALASVKLELVDRCFDKDPDRARQELTDARAVVRDSLVEVREAVTGYRQPSLGSELASARRLLVASQIDCQFDVPERWGLPGEVDSVLAWVVRESVTNVIKHSSARTCRITVTVTDESVTADICDDGVGRRSPRQGGGLSGMGERLARLGGTLETDTVTPSGFQVRAVVPLEVQ